MEGPLKKYGNLLSRWKQKYFRLQPQAGQLENLKSQSGAVKRAYTLNGAQVDYTKKDFKKAFKVILSDPPQKKIYLKANSQQERDQWFTMIN